MKEIILLKDGEIVLKGLNRRSFEDVLKKNVKNSRKG
jgi:thiamine biosynthesis protein ThiI